MAFKEYRLTCKKSKPRKFDIERFAYDVFAYMLPICGYPQTKIPPCNREANVYIQSDFILNVGLSVLPIVLYQRDDWKQLFEMKYKEDKFGDIKNIQNYLAMALEFYTDFEEEDALGKIQFALAIYNEITLFCDYKGIEVYFEGLPKSFSRLLEHFSEQIENFHQTIESPLNMSPEVSEEWITSFIRNNAIPYGSAKDVSEKFSMYAFESFTENDDPDETSTEGIEKLPPDVIAQASNVPDTKPDSSLIEYSQPRLCNLPAFSGHQEKDLVELHGRHKRRISNALRLCLKGRKRQRSPNLDIDEAFRGISLDKEDVSSENSDIKRRRQASGKGT